MTYEQWKHENWQMVCDTFEQRMSENYTPRERVILVATDRLDARFEQHARQLYGDKETD